MQDDVNGLPIKATGQSRTGLEGVFHVELVLITNANTREARLGVFDQAVAAEIAIVDVLSRCLEPRRVRGRGVVGRDVVAVSASANSAFPPYFLEGDGGRLADVGAPGRVDDTIHDLIS